VLNGFIVGDAEVQAKFDKASDEVQAALKNGIARAVLRVQVRTKEKLSDQVLRVRTGRLRRSITTQITEQPGRVEGVIGTIVKYARPHEFGFNGTVNVREHLRKAVNAAKPSVVRAHSRHVVIPEKSFLRSSLRELSPEIQTELRHALDQTLKLGK
jgi:phage gpG-like protein